MDFSFALSHGLFSSNGIDGGTRFLLKVLSGIWDEGGPLPRAVLDAGCGAGIMAVCAAGALGRLYTERAAAFHVRAQDRDELARLFTAYNAAQNGIAPENLSACTEPLLEGPPGAKWDLVLSNVPAKAGLPVLEDFIRRLGGLLAPGGRAVLVVVHTLADLFRRRLLETGGKPSREEQGGGYSVFVYESGPGIPAADTADGGLFAPRPAYMRAGCDLELEGTALHIDTVYGASGFDNPGGAVLAAVKLAGRLPPALPGRGKKALVHEGGQGWFPAWLIRAWNLPPHALVLSGRNILALMAAAHNTGVTSVIPAAELFSEEQFGDFFPGGNSRAEKTPFDFIAAFPEYIPGPGRHEALWEGISLLLAEGGLALVSFSSGEAERFDRKKPAGFTRKGDLKRDGFRALAYGRRPAVSR
ncbi:MAG: methyltransferase [Treponema sp.]|nr:methyltransferase [Treponema sp.]